MHRRIAIAATLALAALAVPSSAAANDAPVCTDTFWTTSKNTPVNVSGGCTDPDGPAPLNYSVVQNTGPFPGTLTNLNPAGSATYNPASNFVGDDSFGFTATDGDGATAAPATAHITVTDGDATNDPPVCPSPTYFVTTGSSTVLQGNCADPEGQTLSYFVDSFPDPAVGSLSLIPPDTAVFNATATPGSTSLGYHARDNIQNSNPATVFLNTVLPGGGEFGEGSAPSASDPAEASITTTGSGSVIVTQVAVDGTTTAEGLVMLPFLFEIEAPSGSPGDPLTLTFRLDSTAIPAGHDQNSLIVLRDGGQIANCTGSGLGPDPCVSERTLLGDGDIQLTVLSSHASRWNFAVPQQVPQPARPGKGCGDRNHSHAREGDCKKPAK